MGDVNNLFHCGCFGPQTHCPEHGTEPMGEYDQRVAHQQAVLEKLQDVQSHFLMLGLPDLTEKAHALYKAAEGVFTGRVEKFAHAAYPSCSTCGVLIKQRAYTTTPEGADPRCVVCPTHSR